jgi:hypothetical protein
LRELRDLDRQLRADVFPKKATAAPACATAEVTAEVKAAEEEVKAEAGEEEGEAALPTPQEAESWFWHGLASEAEVT